MTKGASPAGEAPFVGGSGVSARDRRAVLRGDAELHRAGLVDGSVEDLLAEGHGSGLLEVDARAALLHDLVTRLGRLHGGDVQALAAGDVGAEAQAGAVGGAGLLGDGLDDGAGVLGEGEHGLALRSVAFGDHSTVSQMPE